MPSHKVVHEKSQENQQIAQAVQSHVQGKLIPEPGWMPLTDTPIGMYIRDGLCIIDGARRLFECRKGKNLLLT